MDEDEERRMAEESEKEARAIMDCIECAAMALRKSQVFLISAEGDVDFDLLMKTRGEIAQASEILEAVRQEVAFVLREELGTYRTKLSPLLVH